MSRPLAGRTALVTGASRGIGEATARALAVLGEVVAIDSEDCDLADESAIRRVLRDVRPDICWVGDVPKFHYSTSGIQDLGWKPALGSEAAVLRAINEIARWEGF